MEKNIDLIKPHLMRKHPHKEPESPVCGNCSNFENEDAEGGGFCNEQNRMRHCSCIACNQWQERQTAEVLGKVLGARVEIRRIEIPEKETHNQKEAKKKPRRSQERRVK